MSNSQPKSPSAPQTSSLVDSPTILVGIAAYRDPELLNTINDCLEKAKHPGQLTFAIVNQYDSIAAARLLEYSEGWNVRLVQLDYRESRGVGFSRHLMTDLYLNEDFILQLDAHTRFDQDWDEILLQEWRACNNPKAILTTYPTAWRYTDDGESSSQIEKDPYWDRPIHLAPGKAKIKDFIPILQPFFSSSLDGRPIPAFGLGACFVFGPGDSFKIPYIREVTFFGEELIRSFQLFSFGFDLYAPIHLPLYHKDRGQDLPPRFWRDADDGIMKATHERLQARNYQFVRDFFADSLPPEYQGYFGNVRTLQDYIDYGKKLNADVSVFSKNPI